MNIVAQADLSPQTLYRFFNAKNVLLYVGITNDAGTRWRHHSRKKGWWREVSYVKVEHFKTRAKVEAAEKAAIIQEKPLHNVIFNGRRVGATVVTRNAAPQGAQEWTFNFRETGGVRRTTPLWLNWEVYGDPISDDYGIDEIDSEDLWVEWVRQYPRHVVAERLFGRGAAPISWYIEGQDVGGGAPFQDRRWFFHKMRDQGWTAEESREYLRDTDFLTHHTEPRDPDTGERIRWATLPVVDKIWRTDDLPVGPYTSKGGFIQEATGWKPSPLQPYVNVEILAGASGLARPSSYAPRELQVA